MRTGFSTFIYKDTKLRDMTVFECTLFRQHIIEGMESGFNYFLDTYPQLYLEGDITPELIEESMELAYPFYNEYWKWLLNPITEEEQKHLKRDCFVLFNGKPLKNPSKYVPWVTCLFLPLLNNDLGIMQREVFEGSRADQPYRAAEVLSIINSIYSEWSSKKRKELESKSKTRKR